MNMMWKVIKIIGLIIWLICPLAAFMLRITSLLDSNDKRRTILRYLLIGASWFVSFCLYANYDNIRDSFGYNNVTGYSVTYMEEHDFDEDPAIIETKHWSGKLLLEIVQWVFLLIVFLVPLITWWEFNKAEARLIKYEKYG